MRWLAEKEDNLAVEDFRQLHAGSAHEKFGSCHLAQLLGQPIQGGGAPFLPPRRLQLLTDTSCQCADE